MSYKDQMYDLTEQFKQSFGDKQRQDEILAAIDSLELSRMFAMESE